MATSKPQLFACSFFFLPFSTKCFKTLAVVRLYCTVFFRFSSFEIAFLRLGCFSAQAGSFMVIWKKVECRSTEMLLLIFSCVLAVIMYMDGCMGFVVKKKSEYCYSLPTLYIFLVSRFMKAKIDFPAYQKSHLKQWVSDSNSVILHAQLTHSQSMLDDILFGLRNVWIPSSVWSWLAGILHFSWEVVGLAMFLIIPKNNSWASVSACIYPFGKQNFLLPFCS